MIKNAKLLFGNVNSRMR